MTLQSTTPFPWPKEFRVNGSLTFDDTQALPAGAVLRAPKTGNISKVHVTLGDSINPAGALECRLETVSLTTGLNTGTLLATNTNKSDSGFSSTDAGKTHTWTLTAVAAVTQGQEIAVWIALGAAGSGRLCYGLSSSAATSGASGYPYVIGGGSKIIGMPMIALEYDDGTIHNPVGCLCLNKTVTATVINTGTTPDEIGLKFQVPFPTRLVGLGFILRAASNGDYTIKLYDAANSLLTSAAMDKDLEAVGGGSGETTLAVMFPASITLTKNVDYRVTILPGSATNDIIQVATVQTAALMAGMPGGANLYQTERKSAGAWTDTTTKRPIFWLYLDAFDDGVSVGGETASVFSG